MARGLPSYRQGYRRKRPRFSAKVAAVPYRYPSISKNYAVSASSLRQYDKVTNTQRVDLLSEHLSLMDSYTQPISPTSSSWGHRNSIENMDLMKSIALNAAGAPERQKVDAGKSIGGHLKWFGKQLLNVLSVPGEQMAAEVILGVQKRFIKGEQHFERAVRLEAERAGNAWYAPITGNRRPLYKIAREEGLGVTKWISLPLEIVLDPLNILLTPAGSAAIQSIKGVAKSTKLIAEIASKTNTMTLQSAMWSGRKLFGQKVGEGYKMITMSKEEQIWGALEALPVGEIGKAAYKGQYKTITAATRLFRRVRGVGAMAAEDALPLKDTEITRLSLAEEAEELREAELAWGSQDREAGFLIRGIPNRNVLHNVLEYIDETLRRPNSWISKEESWILKALYHLGLRPAELKILSAEGLFGPVIQTDPTDLFRGYKNTENPQLRIGGFGEDPDKVGYRNIESVENDTIKFLEEYEKARESLVGSTRREDAAFFLPLTGSGFTQTGKLEVKKINQLFKRAIEEAVKAEKILPEDAKEILSFYTNTSYVFRLSKANSIYQTTNSIPIVMNLLGHTSPVNTGIYISSGLLALEPISETFRFGNLFDNMVDTEGLLGEAGNSVNALDYYVKLLGKGLSTKEHYRKGVLIPAREAKDVMWSIVNQPASSRKGVAAEVPSSKYNNVKLARIALFNRIKPIEPEWLKKLKADDPTFKTTSLQEKAIGQYHALYILSSILNQKYLDTLIMAESDVLSKGLVKLSKDNAALINNFADALITTSGRLGMKVSGFGTTNITNPTLYGYIREHFEGATRMYLDRKRQIQRGGRPGGRGAGKIQDEDIISGASLANADFSSITGNPGFRARIAAWLDKTDAERGIGGEFEFGMPDIGGVPGSGWDKSLTGWVVRRMHYPAGQKIPVKDGKLVSAKNSREHWVITDWVYSKKGPNKGTVLGAHMEKLASELGSEGEYFWHAGHKVDPHRIYITTGNMKAQKWVRVMDDPIDEGMLSHVTKGGRKGVESSEVAAQLHGMGYKGFLEEKSFWKDMDGVLGQLFSDPSLELGGYRGKRNYFKRLLRQPMEAGEVAKDEAGEALQPLVMKVESKAGNFIGYRFNDEVSKKFIDINEAPGGYFTHGNMSKESQIIARRPDPTPGADFTGSQSPPGGRIGSFSPSSGMGDGSDKSIWKQVQDIIRVPEGMNQVRRFYTDGNVAKTIHEWTKEVPYANKVIKMLTQGFYPTDAGKLATTRAEGSTELEFIARSSENMIADMGRAYGYRTDGLITTLKTTPELDDLIDTGLKTGVWPDVSPGAAKDMWHYFTNLTKEGTMKQAISDGWTQAQIDDWLKSWSYNTEMRRITTLLQTPRDMLDKWYMQVDGTAGLTAKQMELYDAYHMFDAAQWNLMEVHGYNLSDVLKYNLKKIDGVPSIDPTFVPFGFLNSARGFPSIQRISTGFGTEPVQWLDRKYNYMIRGELDAQLEFIKSQTAGGFKGEAMKLAGWMPEAFPGTRKFQGRSLYNQDPVKAMVNMIKSNYTYLLDQSFMNEFEKLGLPKAMQQTVVDSGFAAVKFRKQVALLGDEATELTNVEREKATKWYGSDWASVPIEELEQQLKQYQNMSDAWNSAGQPVIKKGRPLQGRLTADESAAMADEFEAVSGVELRKTVLPADAVEELQALYSDIFVPVNPLINIPATISGLVRVMATGADLGVMFLHGFGGIGMMLSLDPTTPLQARAAWAKSAKNMMHAMVSPEVRTAWMNQNREVLREMQKYNVSFMNRALLEDMPIPSINNPAGFIAKHRSIERLGEIATRPMEMFGFFLDMSKAEMWKGFSPAITNAKNLTQIQKDLDLTELAAGLNAVHGTLDPAVAGLRYKQRVFESAFLLYAALFRRASMALIGDMFMAKAGAADTIGRRAGRGGGGGEGLKWRRSVAAKSISGMLAAGGLFASAVYASGLNDNVFEPDSPDFMSAKVGPMRVGIGTPFYSFIRLGDDVFRQLKNDPLGLASFDIQDHVVLRRMRSQASPFTSLVTDMAVGRTFVGDPLRDTDGQWMATSMTRRFYRQFSPFWVENIIEQPGIGKATALAELFGLRSSPISTFAQLDEARTQKLLIDNDSDVVQWRSEQMRRGLPVNSHTAPLTILRSLSRRYQELDELEKKQASELNVRGKRDQQKRQQFIEGVNLNREESDNRLEGIAQAFERGGMSGKDFRANIDSIEASLRGANAQLAETFSEVVEEFDKKRTARIENPADRFFYDVLYDSYRQEVTSSPLIHDVYGNFRPSQFKQLQTGFRLRVGEKAWRYIQQRRKIGRNLPGAVSDLQSARETLTDFWNTPEKLWGVGSVQSEAIEDYRTASTREGQRLHLKRIPLLNRWLKKVRDTQDKMRITDPKIDKLLTLYYDYSPMTALGEEVKRKRDMFARNISRY